MTAFCCLCTEETFSAFTVWISSFSRAVSRSRKPLFFSHPTTIQPNLLLILWVTITRGSTVSHCCLSEWTATSLTFLSQVKNFLNGLPPANYYCFISTVTTQALWLKHKIDLNGAERKRPKWLFTFDSVFSLMSGNARCYCLDFLSVRDQRIDKLSTSPLLWKPNCWMALKDRPSPKEPFHFCGTVRSPTPPDIHCRDSCRRPHTPDNCRQAVKRNRHQDLFRQSLWKPYMERAEGMWSENYLINWQTSVAWLSLVIKSSPSLPPFHIWLPRPLFPCHSVRLKWIF